MKEIWKSIKGYNRLYSVSNLGRIRRDIGGMGLCKKGRILKQDKGKNGYLSVNLCKNGVPKRLRTAQIVTKEFIGEPKKNHEVNHKNGIKTDNNLNNLEYLTPSENVLHHYHVLGHKAVCGTKQHMAKLNEKKVLKIRNLYESRIYGTYKLAKDFNVSQSIIWKVIKRITWKHIK